MRTSVINFLSASGQCFLRIDYCIIADLKEVEKRLTFKKERTLLPAAIIDTNAKKKMAAASPLRRLITVVRPGELYSVFYPHGVTFK